MLKNISGPERANVLTHLPGAIFGLVGMVVFFDQTWSVLIFSLTFLAMFSTSSIYHYTTDEVRKRKWRVADHISIFCLIAGTYTPFVMIYLNNPKGHLILQVLWGCVIAGTILKIFFTGRFRVVSTIIYLVMGWMAIFVLNDFLVTIPTAILIWIGLGGLFYTLGTIFYIWKSRPYNHAIWHVFVLAGAMCHWVGVWMSVS